MVPLRLPHAVSSICLKKGRFSRHDPKACAVDRPLSCHVSPGRIRPWTSSRRLRLGRVLGLLLLPLLPHAGATLDQQDGLGAFHDRVALEDELVIRVGGQAVLHPIPLPERHYDGPGQRWRAGEGR
jgi:hypothetical protein